jgi:uncharacterized membrane protein
MRQNLIAYLATAIAFFGMDFMWLSFSTSRFYKPKLGAMLLDKPNLPVAGIFYLAYVVGILVFAVLPALDKGDYTRAIWAGALFGFLAYGTYDLTNQATLVGWPIAITIVDMAWGTFATAVAATIGFFVTRALS